MKFHQDMYRRYPKKQDHGTRGSKKESLLHWGNYKKGVKQSIKENFRQAKHIFKVELNKISIQATDEEIERYLLKTQFRPQTLWYEFV